MAPTPLIATKLYAPPARAHAVPRPGLVARLEAARHQRLTVVAAPAGFGKSTLVATWAAGSRVPVAWLSLDEEDRPPLRFLAYVLAALRSVAPNLGERAWHALQAAQPPAPTTVATLLLNELATGSEPIALVLDDYHLVDVEGVRELMTLLLEHAPPRLRLVVTTRSEPHLPIARMRARDQVHELGRDDLRFDETEATAFLSESMGLAMTADDVRALEARTEGWAAGLQLAALALRGRDDVTAFVQSFVGEHRLVLDYLTEEVLRHQPEPVRAFLLAVSVLDRLCGPLCDALIDGDDGAAQLQALERANLFLVPLDDERRWYRFHALFAEALRDQALRANAEDVANRHRRASGWFEANGDVGAALRHAHTAGDLERATRLLETAWRPMDRAFQTPTWRAWARSLPDAALRDRPVVAVGLGWAWLGAGDLAAATRWLDIAAAGLKTHEFAPTAQPDEIAFRAVPARIAAGRAFLAQAAGDRAEGEAHARRALALAPDEDPGVAALVAGLLGLAHWARGELDPAVDVLTTGQDSFRALDDTSAALSFSFAIGAARLAQGRLGDARREYEQALDLAAERDVVHPGQAELHVGLAEVLVTAGEASSAAAHLSAADALGAAAVLPGDDGRLAAARARVVLALGDVAEAHRQLDAADRLQVAGPVPDVQPVDAIRARAHLAEGRLLEARAWADAHAALDDAPVAYTDEYARLTLARVRLAAFRADGAIAPIMAAAAALDRVVAAAMDGGRDGTAVEGLVLLSLMRQAMGDQDAALASLATALRLAAPEGHRAAFVAEGPAMARLLHAAARDGVARNLVRGLLDDLRSAAERPSVRADPLEPLSDRERDVLRLLRGTANGPQIARELGVSVHTLRSHTKSIYAKLGVHGRRAAVLRAAELGLD